MSALTHGDLFAGIAGFSLAAERAGMRTLWQVELDPIARSVLARHWPDVARYEDVTTVSGHDLAPVDVITAGFPCQDLSLAGKRAGLDGARSGLFWEIVRIVQEMREATDGRYPQMVVLENVPGLLSSNDGADITMVLDTLEDLGYIIDFDIIDAQYFGVPQRRRRVFIACQHVEHLIQQRTTSSALTIAQCLIEILGGLLIGHSTRSSTARSISVCESGISVDGLLRRMRLFGLEKDGNLLTLQQNLDAATAKCHLETGSWDSAPGSSVPPTRRCEATSSRGTSAGMERLFGRCSTERSWKTTLDGLCSEVRSFTTSTETSTTTDLRIYTCALMSERIGWLICQLNDSSPTYWSAASSALTVIEGFTSYARQSGISLFTPMDRVQSWIDFSHRSADLCLALRDSSVRSWGEILALADGLSGHPAPRREARQGAAARPAGGTGNGGGFSLTGDAFWREGVGPLAASDDNGSNHVVAWGISSDAIDRTGEGAAGNAAERAGLGIVEDQSPTLRARHANAVVASAITASAGHHGHSSPRGDGSDNLVIAIPIQGEAATHSGVGTYRHPSSGVGEDGDPSFTVNTTKTPLVFEARYARNGRGAPEAVCPPLKAQSGQTGKGDSAPLVFQQHTGGSVSAAADQADTREVLRAVRQHVGEEAFSKWSLGIVAALRSQEVLQPELHGAGLRNTANDQDAGEFLSGGSTDAGAGGTMLALWCAESTRRASQEWRLVGQLADQFGAYLSELSQPGARQGQALHRLWHAAEGLGLLRDALSAVQEIWRPADDEGLHAGGLSGMRGTGERPQPVRQTLHGSQASRDALEKGVGGLVVRRLTPL